jgi:hypothetical protein
MWNGWKLSYLGQSTRSDKKMMARFVHVSGQTRTTHFGAAGMSDFTLHKDVARRERYFNRHRNNETWSDPLTAGSLSRYILWNKPSLRASIADYKRRFGF